MSEIKEECGLFGIWDNPDAAEIAYIGIFSLQHRGEESAGMATTDGEHIRFHKGMGHIGDVFTTPILERLSNPAAIAHTRYSTTGSSNLNNSQPLIVSGSKGKVALAHNGNITNSRALRDEMEAYGSIFATTNDSEILLHLISQPKYGQFKPSLKEALTRLEGAYSMLLLTPTSMTAVRDPGGFRPLSIGRLRDSIVFSSESCSFDTIGAEFERDVMPGEMVYVDATGLYSEMFAPADAINPSHCIFEHVYFARPDSLVFGQNVHFTRVAMGRQLAREYPVEADIVISIPDSGNSAALGYSLESGIPLDHGFIRNHYVGRTFIQPHQSLREKGVSIKLNAVAEVIRNKRVVVVDDSIIRGTTSQSRVAALRRAGAKEIHFRVSCPPTKFGCFYGIDFPNPEFLIANRKTPVEIARHLKVESLGYLSIDGLLGCLTKPPTSYCTACFSGNYPEPVRESLDKLDLEQ
ncbi:amidophosphoribosyltransferase [Planctomycetota bacterium]